MVGVAKDMEKKPIHKVIVTGYDENLVKKVVSAFTSTGDRAGQIQVYKKTLMVDNDTVNVVVFKVPGTPKLRELRGSLYVGASGVIIVFSMASVESLYNALYLVEELLILQMEGKIPDIKIVLLGIRENGEILNQQFLRQVCSRSGMEFLVISLRNKNSIEHAFKLAIF